MTGKVSERAAKNTLLPCAAQDLVSDVTRDPLRRVPSTFAEGLPIAQARGLYPVLNLQAQSGVSTH
ncbi:hypothetical protein EON64_15260 [archaeon]|nr:MAG: hypothetical protein EON64_15260 [archaeon]